MDEVAKYAYALGVRNGNRHPLATGRVTSERQRSGGASRLTSRTLWSCAATPPPSAVATHESKVHFAQSMWDSLASQAPPPRPLSRASVERHLRKVTSSPFSVPFQTPKQPPPPVLIPSSRVTLLIRMF